MEEILNKIYDEYKESIKIYSSLWKSEYSCSDEENDERDIMDVEQLEYFISLLQQIEPNFKPLSGII